MDGQQRPPTAAAEDGRQRLDYNAPLLSIRRLNDGPGGIVGQRPGGQFYKISAELSKESLRIPGAVPFGWEQTPGRCKPVDDDEVLADMSLSRQRSLRSSATASARFSAPSPPDNHDALSDAAFSATTDAFTAGCRVSVDDLDAAANSAHDRSCRSDARDFIMHRFLPAAQTIACDSPQTPNRRPLGSATPLHHHHHPASNRSPLPHPIASPRPPASSSSSLHDLFNEEDDDRPDPFDQQKACGMFPSCFRNAFLQFHRRSFHSSSSSTSSSSPRFKSPRHKTHLGPPLRASKLADMLRDNAASSDDDQDVVAQVQANAQQKRVLQMREQAMASPARAYTTGSPLHQLFVLEEAGTPNYYDAPSRFSPSVNVSPYKNEVTTMSPFPEGKKFLGFPKGVYGGPNNVSIQSESRSNGFNCYGSSSPRSAVISGGHQVPYPSQIRDAKTDLMWALSRSNGHVEGIGAPAGNHVLGGAGVEGDDLVPALDHNPEVVDAASQQPYDGEQGEIAPEKKSCPLISRRAPSSSPSRFFENRKWPEMGSPAVTLGPPLPKSPSESWLWRAIPLRATTGLSPLSDSRKASILHAKKPFDLSFRDDSLEAAKWEAIVKGSHVQPGHLRFSEELIHQSDNPMKIGAF